MDVSTLLADPAAIHLESFVSEPNSITIVVRSFLSRPRCPKCDQPSSSFHSNYQRSVADLPWHGVAIKLLLLSRKFRCRNSLCPQKVFCERLPNVVAPYARKTVRLNEALTLLAFALGGAAGSRTALALGLTISGDSLLRRIRRFALPHRETPRVLGIDDWAKRRGHSYGTILVDLEKRKPIELLADREATTVAAWLQTHPGVEIISRDRGGAYGEAARKGAPKAAQVADRWHLLKNLGHAVEGFLLSHYDLLSAVAKTAIETAPQAAHLTSFERENSKTDTQVSDNPQPTRAMRDQQTRRSRRQHRYEQVRALAESGLTKRAIARQTKLSRVTVRKYLTVTRLPEISKRQSWSAVDTFLPYLQQRWEAGCRNATQLWREIREQGYRGSAVMVRLKVRGWRGSDGRRDRHSSKGCAGKRKNKMKPLSPRRAMWLLLRETDKLSSEEMAMRGKLLDLSAEIERVIRLAWEFQKMVREGRVEELGKWLAEARAIGVREMEGFAAGIEQDKAAVEGALSSEWSNGQTEGQINRLKLLKRQMYGRAKFDLLRARVLHKV